jgi:peptidyl-prolyl cis-trans isomerase SurA
MSRFSLLRNIWLLLLLAAPVRAQELADRVVAVVDKTPIFASDVERAVAEEVYVRGIRGEPVPADSAEMESLKERFLESLIDRRIVIAKARKEEIEVTATEVEDGLDQWLIDLSKSVGSEEAFLAELKKQGMTLGDLKARYRKEIEEQLYVSKFMRKQFGVVDVSEEEMSRFFQDKYDSIPHIPEVVGIAHIVISVKMSPRKEEEVHAKVTRAMQRLRSGEAFESVARDLSEDAATAGAGGDIGRVALSDLPPEIGRVVSGLEVGKSSEPVRTTYGIEIMKLDERADGAYKMRHIFFGFAPDARDSADARQLAEDLRARLAAGESFDSLAKAHSDDASTRDLGGRIGEIEMSGLSPAYQEALAALSPGDVSPVVLSPGGYLILNLSSRTPSRKPGYDEAKNWIRSIIEARKREKALEEWLAAARQEIYVKKLD